MASCFPFAHLTKIDHCWFALTLASMILGIEASNVKTPPSPRPHLAGSRVVLLVKARRLPAADVRHKPSDQIVAESGAVDHLEERVSNAFEMSIAMVMVLLGGLR